MKNYILLFFAAVISTSFASNIEYDGWLHIKLLHSFGTSGNFVSRGNLSIQSIRSGSYTLEQIELTPGDIENLKVLSKSDDFYQLKSVAQSSDGTESTFLSSMKAETLLESGLNDCISIWFLHNGAVAAIGISPSKIQAENTALPDIQHNYNLPNVLTTEVFMRHMEQAPIPDTASYIQKLEREREAREKGEFKDNRSFFAKYWMYIVPIAIFVLLSGAANPEQTAAR